MRKLIDELIFELVRLNPEYAHAYDISIDQESIKLLRQVVGHGLPVDFEDLYSIINGGTQKYPAPFVYGYGLSSIKEVLRLTQRNDEYSKDHMFDHELDYADPQIDGNYMYSKYRLPIAETTRQQICVDLAPSSKGTFGQVIFCDAEYQTLIYLAESVTELIARFISDIRQGNYAVSKNYESHLTCRWSISLTNWQWSDRWLHIPFDRTQLRVPDDEFEE